MPETAIFRWAQPFVRFFQIESASGFLLLACTAVALLLANSPWSESFAEIWQIRVHFGGGDFEFNKSLLLFIKDGLMTISFFVVGLEIKRELVAGELRDPSHRDLLLHGHLLVGSGARRGGPGADE
jgi:NhaA family Na+:H+ antiporter